MWHIRFCKVDFPLVAVIFPVLDVYDIPAVSG